MSESRAFHDTRWDWYTRLVGKDENNQLLPVTRIIQFKTRKPSLHNCDGRCLMAKGGNCECSCQGSNHGAGRI